MRHHPIAPDQRDGRNYPSHIAKGPRNIIMKDTDPSSTTNRLDLPGDTATFEPVGKANCQGPRIIEGCAVDILFYVRDKWMPIKFVQRTYGTMTCNITFRRIHAE